MRLIQVITISILLQSCFCPKITTETKVEKQPDTLYKDVVKEILKPIEKLVYPGCNDTAYLMTIEALNRSLDSTKSAKEKKIIIKQIKEVLSQRDAKELKEQKEANKLAIEQINGLNERIATLQKILKQKEITERKTGSGSCNHIFLIIALVLLIALLFWALLKKK
jgi:hypothetical protein